MKARLSSLQAIFSFQAIFGILLASSAARAADRCVGPSATGDGSGSDWKNQMAWSATPARGDTWYLADGAYSGKDLSVPADGATPITIKKATLSEHGPSAGWDDALGDGQASFTSALNIDSPHWVLDGQTGGGPGRWKEGFGFKITSTDDSAANVRIGYQDTADDVTVRHVDLEGKGSASNQGGGFSNDAVAIYGCSNITVSYAWIHGAGRAPFFIDTADSVFEYVHVESYFASDAVHAEVASIWAFGDLPIGDITFRNNLFTHVVSTGGLMFDNSSAPASHLYVYGNVFYKAPGEQWDEANGLIGGWTGGGGEEMHNVWVFHNTFINVDQASLSTLPNITSGGRAYNNLFYNSQAPSFEKFPDHDDNHFVSSGDTAGEPNGTSGDGDPFVDAASLDFTLKANTAPGKDLGAPYDVDPLGHKRSTWTRGAYEFCEGASCGTGGSGGTSTGSTTATGGDAATGGTTASGGSAAGGGTGGTGGSKEDAGCGCRLSAHEHEDARSWLWLLVPALAVARRGRRRRRA